MKQNQKIHLRLIHLSFFNEYAMNLIIFFLDQDYRDSKRTPFPDPSMENISNHILLKSI